MGDMTAVTVGIVLVGLTEIAAVVGEGIKVISGTMVGATVGTAWVMTEAGVFLS